MFNHLMLMFHLMLHLMSLTITAWKSTKALIVRTLIQVNTVTIPVAFSELHLAHMGVLYSRGCEHNPKTPLHEKDCCNILTSSVAAPLVLAEGWDKSLSYSYSQKLIDNIDSVCRSHEHGLSLPLRIAVFQVRQIVTIYFWPWIVAK